MNVLQVALSSVRFGLNFLLDLRCCRVLREGFILTVQMIAEPGEEHLRLAMELSLGNQFIVL